MGNTDKFDMIANSYDTSERVQIAKVSSDAINEYLIDTKSKDAIDFGCGTGLVGMNLLNEFRSILFLDTSQNMLNIIGQKISDSNALNASTLCFDFETSTQPSTRADYIFMAQVKTVNLTRTNFWQCLIGYVTRYTTSRTVLNML